MMKAIVTKKYICFKSSYIVIHNNLAKIMFELHWVASVEVTHKKSSISVEINWSGSSWALLSQNEW